MSSKSNQTLQSYLLIFCRVKGTEYSKISAYGGKMRGGGGIPPTEDHFPPEIFFRAYGAKKPSDLLFVLEGRYLTVPNAPVVLSQ